MKIFFNNNFQLERIEDSLDSAIIKGSVDFDKLIIYIPTSLKDSFNTIYPIYSVKRADGRKLGPYVTLLAQEAQTVTGYYGWECNFNSRDLAVRGPLEITTSFFINSRITKNAAMVTTNVREAVVVDDDVYIVNDSQIVESLLEAVKQVATYAYSFANDVVQSYSDLANVDPMGNTNFRVVVLNDSNHDNNPSMYQWNGTEWTFKGYFDWTNYLDEKFTAYQTALDTEIDDRLDAQDETIAGLGQLHPAGVKTTDEIEDLTSDSGIWISSTDGYWYYWDAANSEYKKGELYQATFYTQNIHCAFSLLTNNNAININTTEGTITIPAFVYIGDYSTYITFSETTLSVTIGSEMYCLSFNPTDHSFSWTTYTNKITGKVPILIYYSGYIVWSCITNTTVNGSATTLKGNFIVDGTITDAKLGTDVNVQRYFTQYWYPNGTKKYINFDLNTPKITIQGYLYADTQRTVLGGNVDVNISTSNDFKVLVYNISTNSFSIKGYSTTLTKNEMPLVAYIYNNTGLQIVQTNNVLVSINGEEYNINSLIIPDDFITNAKLNTDVNVQRYFAPYWYENEQSGKINFNTSTNKIEIPKTIYADTKNARLLSATSIDLPNADSSFRTLVYDIVNNSFSLVFYNALLNKNKMPLVTYFRSASRIIIVWTNNVLVSVDGVEYHIWKDVVQPNSIIPDNLTDLSKSYKLDEFSIFKTFGVVGDSITAGLSQKANGTYTTNENLSWGACLARKHSLNYHNFGISGATAKSWITDKLPTLLSTEKCMCYIIGLGYNDTTIDGSTSDIDLSDPDNNADTWYGNYAKIIQKIHAYAPNSNIFVCTLPYTGKINTALTNIVQYLEISQVCLIDLNANKSIFEADFIHNHINADGIHFNPMGYENIANAMYYLISKYMKDNNATFVDSAYITYS